MNLTLYKKEVEDEVSRENFVRIEGYVRDEVFRKGKFRFIEFVLSGAVTSLRIAHNLKFTPLDVILLSVRNSDSSAITWHYDDFDSSSIVVSSTGACTVRAYIGRYGES